MGVHREIIVDDTGEVCGYVDVNGNVIYKKKRRDELQGWDLD